MRGKRGRSAAAAAAFTVALGGALKLTEKLGASSAHSAPAPTTPAAPTTTSSGGYDPGYGY